MLPSYFFLSFVRSLGAVASFCDGPHISLAPAASYHIYDLLFSPWPEIIVEDNVFLYILENVSIVIRRSIANPREQIDVCQFCGKKFEREEILAIHVLQEHDYLIGNDDDKERQ
jgi:hypothetical protein